MFVFISEKHCPSCGTMGKIWKKDPEVFMCPHCSSFYNEFGVVLEAKRQEEFI